MFDIQTISYPNWDTAIGISQNLILKFPYRMTARLHCKLKHSAVFESMNIYFSVIILSHRKGNIQTFVHTSTYLCMVGRYVWYMDESIHQFVLAFIRIMLNMKIDDYSFSSVLCAPHVYKQNIYTTQALFLLCLSAAEKRKFTNFLFNVRLLRNGATL